MEEFLTVKDVARIFKFSRQEIYKMVAKKEIPFTRFKKRGIRFLRKDLEVWYKIYTLKPEAVLKDHFFLIQENSIQENSKDSYFISSEGEDNSSIPTEN